MAKKRRRKKRQQSDDQYPGWIWMLFGLGIGLSVAAAVYFGDRPLPATTAPSASVEPAPAPSSAPALDNNGETAVVTEDETKARFDFYELLKKIEVEVEEAQPSREVDSPPRAVVEEGTYILQAGSFTTAADGERRRAELALHGIESRVVPVPVNGQIKHRVYIGPTSDLDELNMLRSRLRAAKIDALRMTVTE